MPSPHRADMPAGCRASAVPVPALAGGGIRFAAAYGNLVWVSHSRVGEVGGP